MASNANSPAPGSIAGPMRRISWQKFITSGNISAEFTHHPFVRKTSSPPVVCRKSSPPHVSICSPIKAFLLDSMEDVCGHRGGERPGAQGFACRWPVWVRWVMGDGDGAWCMVMVQCGQCRCPVWGRWVMGMVMVQCGGVASLGSVGDCDGAVWWCGQFSLHSFS